MKKFIIILVINFNYTKIIKSGVYAKDINFEENKISLKILSIIYSKKILVKLL
jgi:hypothetical protein